MVGGGLEGELNEKGGVRCGSELVAGASSCLSLKAPRVEDGWAGRVPEVSIHTLLVLAVLACLLVVF